MTSTETLAANWTRAASDTASRWPLAPPTGVLRDIPPKSICPLEEDVTFVTLRKNISEDGHNCELMSAPTVDNEARRRLPVRASSSLNIDRAKSEKLPKHLKHRSISLCYTNGKSKPDARRAVRSRSDDLLRKAALTRDKASDEVRHDSQGLA